MKRTAGILIIINPVLYWKKKPVIVFLCGFIAAFIDESIQLLSGRGAMIQDVWIDLTGVAAGFLLCRLILKIIGNCRRMKP